MPHDDHPPASSGWMNGFKLSSLGPYVSIFLIVFAALVTNGWINTPAKRSDIVKIEEAAERQDKAFEVLKNDMDTLDKKLDRLINHVMKNVELPRGDLP